MGAAIAASLLANAGLDYVVPSTKTIFVPAAEPIVYVPFDWHWQLDPSCPPDKIFYIAQRSWAYIKIEI
jgi:hypothetical protein